MTDILMPALSPTMEEGTLAKWHVKAGDMVKSGDVIAEIETDKATMEVEAVDEGVVQELLVPEGSEGVKVNAVIARLAGEGETEPKPAEPSVAPKAAPPAPERPRLHLPPRPCLLRRPLRRRPNTASSPRPWRGGSRPRKGSTLRR